MDGAAEPISKNDGGEIEAVVAKDKATVDHRKIVKSCMSRLLRVCMVDGRIIEGRLDCYDKQGNMILINALDVTRENDKPHGRVFRLGTVMVPAGATTRVLLRKQDDRKTPNAGTAAHKMDVKGQTALEVAAHGLSTLRIDDTKTAGNPSPDTT